MNIGGKLSTFFKSIKSLKPDFHKKSRQKNPTIENDYEPGTSKDVKEMTSVVDAEGGTRHMTERKNKKGTIKSKKTDNDGINNDEGKEVLEKQNLTNCDNHISAKSINNHIEDKSLQPTTHSKSDGLPESVSKSKHIQEVNNYHSNLTDNTSTNLSIDKQNDIEINNANQKTLDCSNIKPSKSNDSSVVSVPDVKLSKNKDGLDEKNGIEVKDNVDGRKEIINVTRIEQKEIKVLDDIQLDNQATTNISSSTPSSEQDDEHEEKLALDNLANIVREVEEIEKTITNLAANSDEYHHIEQTIIDYLIKLDKISSRNSKLIRDERRKCIKYVQGVMTILDDRIKKGQGSKIN